MSQFNFIHIPTPITNLFIYEVKIGLRIKTFDEMTPNNKTKGQVIKSLYDILFKDLFVCVGSHAEYNNSINWNIAEGLSSHLQRELEKV